MNPVNKLDLKDKKIILELEQDCRQSNHQLGRKVGLSPDVVRYRINRLEKNNIIAWHLTFVNFAKLGYTDYGVYINTQHLTKEKEQELIKYLQSHPRISYLAKLGGTYDFLFGTLAKNILDFEQTFSEIMQKIGNHISNKEIATRVHLFHFSKNYLLNHKEPSSKMPHFGGEIQEVKIDLLDQQILTQMSTDARIPIMDFATKLKTPASTIALRLKKLQQKEVINGFFTFTRAQSYGFQNYVITLRFKRITPKEEQKLYTYCQQHPNITYLIKTVGKWDYEVSIEVPNQEFFQAMLSEIREHFSDILSEMEFYTIFKDLKYNLYPFSEQKV